MVRGAESSWNSLNSLYVGYAGSGTLNILESGRASSAYGYVGYHTGATGMVTVSGVDAHWTLAGDLSLGGNASTGASGGNGTLVIGAGGTVTVFGETLLFSGGNLRLEGGALATSMVDFRGSGGRFDFTGGALHVEVFKGHLVNRGGALSPGDSIGDTTIIGGYVQHTGGTISIDIGGPLVSSQYDFVNVTGIAELAGKLEVTLIDGFIPGPQHAFAVLDAGFIAGAFDNVVSGERLITADGSGSFIVNYGPASAFNQQQIVLSAFQPLLLGDFDRDGDVDRDDLLQWQGDFGQNGSSDADDDNDSDGADFLVWQQQLGSPPAAAATAAVPEPGGVILLAVGAIAIYSVRFTK
jgi:T5SS/PEP-CTERM-associated repeat protein